VIGFDILVDLGLDLHDGSSYVLYVLVCAHNIRDENVLEDNTAPVPRCR
jgi:hypothetical protein